MTTTHRPFCASCLDTGDLNHELHRFWEENGSHRPNAEPAFRRCTECPRCVCGLELFQHDGAGVEWGPWELFEVRLRDELLIAPPCAERMLHHFGRIPITALTAFLGLLRIVCAGPLSQPVARRKMVEEMLGCTLGTRFTLGTDN